MKTSERLEGLFDGPAEIVFAMPNAYAVKDTVLFDLLKPRFCLSRYSIRKKYWQYIGSVLKSNWSPSEKLLAYKVYEEDTGNPINYELKASVYTKVKIDGIDAGKTFTGKVKGQIQKHDDQIDQNNWWRDEMANVVMYGRGNGKYKGDYILNYGCLSITLDVTAYKLYKPSI